MTGNIIPPQVEGSKSDNVHHEVCNSREAALDLYFTACNRLKEVSKWETLCNGLLTANFTLCDENGNAVQRMAQEKDFFKIDIPGPGPQDGDGYDWVQIESIVTEPGEEEDVTAIKVRPASSPVNDKEGTAHFFDSNASSTFMIKRKGNTVYAEIHGRNEKPNTENTSSAVDTVRNAVVANAAIASFSDIQWKQLAVGLLS